MFLVCGEALFDVFPAGDTPTGLALDARIGGSPFNVAVGLARLGQAVEFLGGVSQGFLGERLMQALHAEGIRSAAVQRLDAQTTLSLVGVDAGGRPAYSFYGSGAADRQLPASALDAVPAGTRAIHLGSYAMVVEPVAGVQRGLVASWQGRALIAYDPNVRLSVEPSLPRWRDAIDWMAPRTDLLKVSDEDLALLYPGAAPDALAAQWRAQGTGVVVVTRGGDGATAFLRDGPVAIAPVPAAVVDTVGAGDSFQAAMLAALAERGVLAPAALRALPTPGWQEVLNFAAQAAALTCGRRGADLPHRAELP